MRSENPMFSRATATEKETSQKGFLKVGEIVKIASRAHETIKGMPRSVKVFMLGLLGGSVLAGCSTEIPGMAAKADVQAGKKAEKPGIEQVAAQYTKEVKELIAGDPIYEARDGSKVTAKVFAKSMNVDGSDRVLVHVETLSYEGHKGDTQYIGLLNSFGTQDGSAQGYLSLHEAPFDPKTDQATGSKAIVKDMNYFVDATDVQNDGVQLFLTRDSSSILREVLSLQDSGGLKKMPTDRVFFSFDGSKTHNYEILPGNLQACESFFQQIDDSKQAKDFGTTRIVLHMKPDAKIWAGTPVDELMPTELQP